MRDPRSRASSSIWVTRTSSAEPARCRSRPGDPLPQGRIDAGEGFVEKEEIAFTASALAMAARAFHTAAQVVWQTMQGV